MDSLADRGRLTLLEKWLSLAVAVLSLLAALLCYQTARLASQTGGPSAGPDGRAASASPTRSPKQAADRTTDAAVRNAGRIAVGDGSINLDAMPGDSRWGLDSGADGGTRLESYAGVNFTLWSDYAFLEDGAQATRASCSSATAYKSGPLVARFEEVDRGNLCFHMSSGRYGTLRVVKITRDATTYDITTWD